MIKSIKIEVQGRELELTPEEARKLKDELDELMSEKKTEFVPYYPYWPYPVSLPLYQPTVKPYQWPYYEIICGSTIELNSDNKYRADPKAIVISNPPSLSSGDPLSYVTTTNVPVCGERR